MTTTKTFYSLIRKSSLLNKISISKTIVFMLSQEKRSLRYLKNVLGPKSQLQWWYGEKSGVVKRQSCTLYHREWKWTQRTTWKNSRTKCKAIEHWSEFFRQDSPLSHKRKVTQMWLTQHIPNFISRSIGSISIITAYGQSWS